MLYSHVVIKMKNKQFYFIEDQDYANEELKEYKQYLYEQGFIVNNLIIAKGEGRIDF